MNQKKCSIYFAVLIAGLFLTNLSVAAASTTLKTFTAGTGNYTTTITQSKSNYTKAKFEFAKYDALLSSGVTEIQVVSSMTYDGVTTQKETATKDIALIRNQSFTTEYPNFGSYDTTINFLKGKTLLNKVTTKVDIVADEYNLAPLIATLPVTYFTLQLDKITINASGDPIPTFVLLKRADAYNWDKLPESVYWPSNMLKSEISVYKTASQIVYDAKVAKFKDYIKSLYKANPEAKFNLYINDITPYYILELMDANGIPEASYSTTLITDGVASYYEYNYMFNIADPQAKYAQMAADWKKAKEYAVSNKKYSTEMLPDYNNCRYALVVAHEEREAKWWVARKADTLLKTNNTDRDDTINGFYAKYVTPETIVLTKNLNTMLQALTPLEKEQMKGLYGFNSQMFAEAEKQGKKVMMILGSRTTYEPNFGNFSAYAKFLMMQYGDEFVYYYKGHPGTPTKMYPEKEKDLNDLGLIDVESSIPAELILFFYPDLYMAGYDSSTYTSVSKDEMATGLFGFSKATAKVAGSVQILANRDAFQFYMYQNTGGVPSPKIDVSTFPSCNSSHDNYLIDFQEAYLNSQNNLYEIAVFDNTDGMIYYYKKVDAENVLTKVAVDKVQNITHSLNIKTNSLAVKWNKNPKAIGYEIRHRVGQGTTWTTESTTENTKNLTLTKGNTLEFQVRPYVTITNVKFFGDWSNVNRRFAETTILRTSANIVKKQIEARWDKTSTNSLKIFYEIAFTSDKGNTSTYTTQNLTKVFKGLVIGSGYQVKVRPIIYVNGEKFTGAYSGTSYRYVVDAKILKVKSSKTRKAALDLSKNRTAASFDIVYSTSKNFASKKHVYIKGANKKSISISKLSSGRKYFFKVRGYTVFDGMTYYSDYSAVSSQRIK